MRSTEFKVGENEYKLRLGANEIANIEKKLDANLLNMFMETKNGILPKVSDILLVLHGSLQKLNHGITLENVYEMYDEYIESGKTYMDLIATLTEVLQVSGFF